MASYDCGSMNWLNSGLFLNTPKFLTDCGLLFQELGVKPEIEAFDPGMIGKRCLLHQKRRSENTGTLPVLHGLCKRYCRFYEEPDLHERDSR